MICREVWQSNRYGFDIELDDVNRYSLAIVIGSAVHYFVLGNFVFDQRAAEMLLFFWS